MTDEAFDLYPRASTSWRVPTYLGKCAPDPLEDYDRNTLATVLARDEDGVRVLLIEDRYESASGWPTVLIERHPAGWSLTVGEDEEGDPALAVYLGRQGVYVQPLADDPARLPVQILARDAAVPEFAPPSECSPQAAPAEPPGPHVFRRGDRVKVPGLDLALIFHHYTDDGRARVYPEGESVPGVRTVLFADAATLQPNGPTAPRALDPHPQNLLRACSILIAGLPVSRERDAALRQIDRGLAELHKGKELEDDEHEDEDEG